MLPLLVAALPLLLAPAVTARTQGTGPAYYQDPAAYPMHYPSAAAAAEGFVVHPMGGQSYCNTRLVKPVCADGIWVQNRCIAQLQSLKVVPDNQCPESKEVFAGVPAVAGSPSNTAAVTQPLPVTAADMQRHADKGLVFRGVAAPGASSTNMRIGGAAHALESQAAKGLVDRSTGFWWSARPGALDTPK